MPKKLKVGVLMGGPSAERAISLITGKAVYENLDRKKYIPSVIEMDMQSRMFLVSKNKKRPLDFLNADRKLFGIIFIALHGTPGEDGTVQGMFEMLGIPYTGSRTLSSALSMNKVFAAQIYRANGLPHPEFIHFKKEGWKKNKKEVLKDAVEKVGFPAVIKPVDQGSAVGVNIVKSEEELVKAVNKTINKFPWLMVQKFINGQEATCGVLEKNGRPIALPPTHIRPNLGAFYDYKSKYAKGGSTHVCPADFSPEINEQIQHLALLCHKALMCDGMSRTDVFVSDDEIDRCECGHHDEKAVKEISASCHCFRKLYIIETNTIPGMTPTSLLPEAAGKAGIDFKKMLDLIIKACL